jgi:hypothetical protein
MCLNELRQYPDKPLKFRLTRCARNARLESLARSIGMSDIFSILQSSYASAPLSPQSSTPYTNVDPTSYQGSWQGTYSNNQKFEFTISQVNGFRAQVKYQSGSTVQYQQVLIKDSSFRIGDSKFTLSAAGSAQIRTVVTDPATGNTNLITGNAAQGS